MSLTILNKIDEEFPPQQSPSLDNAEIFQLKFGADFRNQEVITMIKKLNSTCKYSEGKRRFIEHAIFSLTLIAKFITFKKFDDWLSNYERLTEVTKGGVLYTLKDGTILGYSNYIYKNKDLIGGGGDESFLLFKKFPVSLINIPF
jgi:hypothetical protein